MLSCSKRRNWWAPNGQLELVKLIERAVYDDDPVDVSLTFLLIFIQYINYMPRLLIHRVHCMCCIVYMNWREERVLPCMPTYLKNSIGLSHWR